MISDCQRAEGCLRRIGVLCGEKLGRIMPVEVGFLFPWSVSFRKKPLARCSSCVEHEEIVRELLGRRRAVQTSYPIRLDEFTYFSRVNGQKAARPCFLRRKRFSLPQVVLDLNQAPNSQLGVLEISPDHNMLAFSLDDSGDEVYVLRFRDLRTGRNLW